MPLTISQMLPLKQNFGLELQPVTFSCKKCMCGWTDYWYTTQRVFAGYDNRSEEDFKKVF
jgi:hypothetical protein